MDSFSNILIIIHATFGGIALLLGLVAIVAPKGESIHKKSGKIFYYSMIASCTTAMVVAFLPGHFNLFLFAIGIFSLYFVLTGYRAIKFKRKDPNLLPDKIISIIMLIVGLAMIIVPVFIFQRIVIVLAVFGLVGIVSAVSDLRAYQNPQKLRKSWLRMHLGKILGGYISAVTAFVVVNQLLPGIYGWLAPGVVGGFLIAYWLRKMSPKKVGK